MSARLWFRVGLGVLFVTACAGKNPPVISDQAAPEVTSSQAPAVFRSTTNLVQVPGVVRDHSGHAVGPLGAEDSQLFDSDKPQVITRFSVEEFGSRGELQNTSFQT